jgi:xylan 1,4-beta-xylosidase
MEFKGVKPNAVVSIRRLDALHGNTQAAYESMGSPRYPTLAQIKELNEASKIGRPDLIVLREGKVELDLPADGLAILEIAK